MDWERRIDSIRGVLGDKGTAGRGRIAPRHRGPAPGTVRIPELLPALDRGCGGPLLIEKGVLTAAELDATMTRQESEGG